jgi:hypothetical protein
MMLCNEVDMVSVFIDESSPSLWYHRLESMQNKYCAHSRKGTSQIPCFLLAHWQRISLRGYNGDSVRWIEQILEN